MIILGDYLNEFNQKKDENKLSYSAYDNLIYNNRNIFINDQNNKKISIIIPTYNRFDQLGELLNSIFNQTYQNSETILIDDVFNDGTIKLYFP